MDLQPEGDAGVRTQPQLRRRELDLAATEASFIARAWHGAVHGIVPVTGGYVLVDADGQPQGVYAELDLAGLSTRNARRDRDLRSKRFFDTAQYPVMRFAGDDVVPSAEGWQVRGFLTISATQCPVVLHVSHGGEHDDGFTATAAVTKQELGVRVPRPLVGTTVALRISAALLP